MYYSGFVEILSRMLFRNFSNWYFSWMNSIHILYYPALPHQIGSMFTMWELCHLMDRI